MLKVINFQINVLARIKGYNSTLDDWTIFMKHLSRGILTSLETRKLHLHLSCIWEWDSIWRWVKKTKRIPVQLNQAPHDYFFVVGRLDIVICFPSHINKVVVCYGIKKCGDFQVVHSFKKELNIQHLHTFLMPLCTGYFTNNLNDTAILQIGNEFLMVRKHSHKCTMLHSRRQAWR